MPTIITCPSCKKQLRLPDNLLGQTVQCPTCSNHFDPVGNGAPAPPSQAAETSAPAPTPANSSFGLNINLSLDDEPSPPPRPQPLSDPAARETAEVIPPWRPPPHTGDSEPGRTPASGKEERDRTDDRDLGRRPERGTDRERDGRGDRDRDFDRDRDWRRDSDRDRPRSWREQDGRGRFRDDDMPRRDTVPHRGGLILTLGVVSLCLVVVGFFFPVSLVLGLCAWVMGGNDLRRMKAGEMDPEGQSNTQGGYICGIIATVLSALATLVCGGFIGLIFLADSQQTVTPTRPRGGLPAAPATKAARWPNPNPPPQIKVQEDDER